MSDKPGFWDKTNVVNFTVIVIVVIIFLKALVELWLAINDPINAISYLDHLWNWLSGIAIGIFGAYGLITNKTDSK